MKNINKLISTVAVVAMLLLSTGMLRAQTPPTGRLKPNTVTIVKVLPANVVDAFIDAAKAGGLSAVTGQPLRIPFELCKNLVAQYCLSSFGEWLADRQICRAFQMWANSCGGKVASGIINIEVILLKPGETQTPTSPRIIISLFAKKEGESGGRGFGYVAPVNASGNPTMSYDVFGDGSFVLKRLECP